jgi:hypothetical protein
MVSRSRTLRKRTISSFTLVFLTLLCLMIGNSVNPAQASVITYNASSAVYWAMNNAQQSRYRPCAEFVAKTMHAGGLGIPETFVGNHQIVAWLYSNRNSVAYTVTQYENRTTMPATQVGDIVFMNKGGHGPASDWYKYGWEHSAVRVSNDKFANWGFYNTVTRQYAGLWNLQTYVNAGYRTFLVVHFQPMNAEVWGYITHQGKRITRGPVQMCMTVGLFQDCNSQSLSSPWYYRSNLPPGEITVQIKPPGSSSQAMVNCGRGRLSSGVSTRIDCSY